MLLNRETLVRRPTARTPDVGCTAPAAGRGGRGAAHDGAVDAAKDNAITDNRSGVAATWIEDLAPVDTTDVFA